MPASHTANTRQYQHVLAQALTARTPVEIEQARHNLEQWLLQHPEDKGMEDAFEVLALRQGQIA